MTRKITLTFDNGPTPGVTEHVLSVLERQQIKATFFVLGKHIANEPAAALMRQAAMNGHWIGNHTYTHSIPLGESPDPDVAENEIGRTQALLGGSVHPQRLFRPFGGGGRLGPHLLNQQTFAYLRDGRYTCVLWNAVPRDFENPDGWIDVALTQCRSLAWTTLVLHDLPNGAMAHLDRFIGLARDEGASFVQDFPPDCVPMVNGEVRLPMEGYVRQPAAGSAKLAF